MKKRDIVANDAVLDFNASVRHIVAEMKLVCEDISLLDEDIVNEVAAQQCKKYY